MIVTCNLTVSCRPVLIVFKKITLHFQSFSHYLECRKKIKDHRRDDKFTLVYLNPIEITKKFC